MLSDKLRARLEKKMINPDKIHEKPATRRFRLLLEKQGREEGKVLGREEGEAIGRAASLLLVLEQRGLPVTQAQRARIQKCTDADQLDAWLARSLTATSVEDLLAANGASSSRASPRPTRRRQAAPRTSRAGRGK